MANTLKDRIKSAAVEQAIKDGDIVVSDDTVSLGAKSSPDGKAHEKPYKRLSSRSVAGMLALSGGVLVGEFRDAKALLAEEKKEDGTPVYADEKAAQAYLDEHKDDASVTGYFDYAFDLAQRNQVRQDLIAEIEGPAKAIREAAEKLVKAGVEDDFEAAKAYVIAQRQKKGLPV